MAKISGKDGKVLHGSEITITGAVHDTGVVTVTAAANGLSVGDRILIGDVVGMTDLNTHFVVATVPGVDSFTVALTTAQTYTSGGTARRSAKITNWNIKKTLGLKETSDSGSVSGKDFLPDGLYEIDGAIEGLIEGGINNIQFGAVIGLVLHEDDDVTWSGNGIINEEGEALQVSGGDPVKFSNTFKGTGAWLRTDNT
ncbi:MAG: hypothetical protein A2V66_03715 [Ignavibacteria bacterium RBG_13_36_8]|nr:MAG: hypothetical protein A2V66_03715 [Ignavibacteria bacterium RBG_13_36_8]